MAFINTKKILSFVNRVERKKRFKREPGLILRHLFEEVGEASRALWQLDSVSTKGTADAYRERVAKECVDVVCLAVYLADVLKVDLDEIFALRIREIAAQYGVECPEAR